MHSNFEANARKLSVEEVWHTASSCNVRLLHDVWLKTRSETTATLSAVIILRLNYTFEFSALKDVNIKAIGHALARDVQSRVHTTTGASLHKEVFMDNGKVTLYYSSEQCCRLYCNYYIILYSSI